MTIEQTLSQKNRALIVGFLSDSKKEFCAAAMSKLTNLSKSTVRKHFSELRELGAVYKIKFKTGVKVAEHFVIVEGYAGSFYTPKTIIKKPTVVRSEGKGTQPFTNHTPMSGQKSAGVFLCNKELTPRLAPKPYVPPRNNPNYTPSGREFLTSGQGRVVDGSK